SSMKAPKGGRNHVGRSEDHEIIELARITPGRATRDFELFRPSLELLSDHVEHVPVDASHPRGKIVRAPLPPPHFVHAQAVSPIDPTQVTMASHGGRLLDSPHFYVTYLNGSTDWQRVRVKGYTGVLADLAESGQAYTAAAADYGMQYQRGTVDYASDRPVVLTDATGGAQTTLDRSSAIEAACVNATQARMADANGVFVVFVGAGDYDPSELGVHFSFQCDNWAEVRPLMIVQILRNGNHPEAPRVSDPEFQKTAVTLSHEFIETILNPDADNGVWGEYRPGGCVSGGNLLCEPADVCEDQGLEATLTLPNVGRVLVESYWSPRAGKCMPGP
ncbi:hypothetical protein, partial [Ramlibacter sp.]|uniref:hypothetical protein n=1 Tax=Ramlibacter sp. TaxID=1917967 RepID=UPI0026057FA1